MTTPLRPPRFYEFGPFRLDASNHVLYKGGEVLPVGPKAVDLLLALIDQRGNTVGREELLKAVWPDTFVEEANLSYNVSILRKALHEGQPGASYIETIPKRGYRFVGDIRVGEANGRAPDERIPARRSKRRMAFAGIASAGVLAVAAVAFWAMLNARRGEIRSVAVLPFLNLSQDAADEYFSDGLTEDLTTALSKLPELKVPARTSAFQFKGKAADIRLIGKQLNVSAVLEGSVRRQSGRLRISAQLSRVSDGYHLWSDTYDREAREVFEIQDEICRSIVTALRVRLANGSARPLIQRYAGDPEAYALSLRGRHLIEKRTRAAIQEGIGYFEQAIQRDGSYAPAYAGLADSYLLLGMFGMIAPGDAFPRARIAAEKTLALDNRLAEGHTSLAAVKAWFDWDQAEAETLFRRAIEVNPGYVLAHQWYAEYLSCQGRHADATSELDRAQALDPLSPALRSARAMALYLARHYDQVIQVAGRGSGEEAAVAPHFLALAWEQQGKYAEAIDHFERSGAWSDLAHVYAESGRRADALAILRRVQERPHEGAYLSPYAVAEVYAGMGDKTQTLSWLERARSERSNWVPYLNVDPRFDLLRSEARFQALLREAGLRH